MTPAGFRRRRPGCSGCLTDRLARGAARRFSVTGLSTPRPALGSARRWLSGERIHVVAGVADTGAEVVLETDRLLLRPWRVAEAGIQRELWTERDPRVPPHRRIDATGRPTVEDLEEWIRNDHPTTTGLLAVEPKAARAVVGYCGLIDSGRGGDSEPELAFELLQKVWRQGYATEASRAVLDWARSSGYTRLWATVRVWNTASRRVLAKVGFVETGRVEQDETYGDNLFTTTSL